MVWIFVYDHVVAVPIPLIGVGKVEGRDSKVKAAEPEAARIASLNAPPVTAAKASVEVTILPGVIAAKPGIVPAIIVAYPLTVTMHVWRLGMIVAVANGSAIIFMMVPAIGLGTMVRNVSAAHIVVAVVVVMIAMLRERRQGNEQQRRENCGEQFHGGSSSP